MYVQVPKNNTSNKKKKKLQLRSQRLQPRQGSEKNC